MTSHPPPDPTRGASDRAAGPEGFVPGAEQVVVVRSEEQQRAGVQRYPTHRLRVRKVAVTEERTVTVTVRREEFVLEEESLLGTAPTDPVHGAPGTGLAGRGEETVEMVLHAEVPTVTLTLVPVERIRVSKHTTTTDQMVTDTVRREVVEHTRDPR